MWTRGLAGWYADHGRHALPWRHTREPWPVLVSEVMLQQTQVARVLGRWERFLDRWPAPDDCARAPLESVLGEWQGLGYPRRAAALHRTARQVAEAGWPPDEVGLRALPGVGRYTARAMLVLSRVGDGRPAPVPCDVNIRRVAARAALGIEPHLAQQRAIDGALLAARPRGMAAAQYVHALFDVGAAHCRATPRCHGCPLLAACAWRRRGGVAVASPRRRPAAYGGSTRQLRGAVLSALLVEPGLSLPSLRRRLDRLPLAGDPGALADAVAGLRADGLLPSRPG